MTIGMFIDPAHTVPPNSDTIAAPWSMVASLTDGLMEAGQSVLLFAAKGSKTKAKLYDIGQEPTYTLKERLSEAQYQRLLVQRQRALFDLLIRKTAAEKISILHVHQPLPREWLWGIAREIPIVATIHNPADSYSVPMVDALCEYKNIHFVAISDRQKKLYGLKNAFTVYHGIDTSLWTYTSNIGNQLLSVGRIMPQKGHEDAVSVAQKLKLPLRIVGKIYYDRADRKEYYERKIRPHVDGTMIHIDGIVQHGNMNKVYGKGLALLFPVKWEEPFGLVMLEAMACGTPVVAYARGSVPEVVEDGVTGYIVNPSETGSQNKGNFIIKKSGLEGLVEAVERLCVMPKAEYLKMRENCRKRVVENFSIDKMVKSYIGVYRKILG